MKYNITLTEDEIALIKATFNAREIRVREWISEAKNEGDEKQVAHWESILEKKKAVMKKINDQTKEINNE